MYCGTLGTNIVIIKGLLNGIIMLIIVCSCLVCDPVMGDEGKLYVPEELVHVYREKVKQNLKKQSDRVLSI